MTKTWSKVIATSAVAILTVPTVITATGVVADAAAKPIKITLWDAMTGPYADALQERIDAFNSSQSKYKVTATSQGDYTTLGQKITAAAKSKTLPVMSQTTYTQIPDYAKQGIVANLDSQVKGKNGLSKKALANIYPGFLQQAKYQGSYYSMPFSASVRVMFYNKDILTKYNLQVPKTWADIQKMGNVLAKDNIAAATFDKSYDMEWNGLVNAAGSQLVTAKGKVQTSSKTAVSAMKLITNMVANKTALTAGSDIYGTTNFVNGKAALAFSSSAGITATGAAAPKGFNWGTAVIPSYKGKHATQLAGNNLMVTSQATKKQQAGAFAFMKFLISDKQTEKWAEKTGYLPITKKAAKSASYQKYLKEHPLAKAATDSLPGAFADPAFAGYDDYRTNMLNAVDSTLTKGTSPAKALKTLTKETKQTIKDNK
ncbi:MAG: ABC transporter substrate-binding protein [Lactobacillaceae bacterium]|jgi:multiple sugar transport system substrate-binding protein|nr:ABC transporter substrate-binding protein [Lactobacillaceae bacterium]